MELKGWKVVLLVEVHLRLRLRHLLNRLRNLLKAYTFDVRRKHADDGLKVPQMKGNVARVKVRAARQIGGAVLKRGDATVGNFLTTTTGGKRRIADLLCACNKSCFPNKTRPSMIST